MQSGFRQFGFRVVSRLVLGVALLLIYLALFFDLNADWASAALAPEIAAAYWDTTLWLLFYVAVLGGLSLVEEYVGVYRAARLLAPPHWSVTLVEFVFFGGAALLVVAFLVTFFTHVFFPQGEALFGYEGDFDSGFGAYLLNYLVFYIRNLVLPALLLAGPVYLTYKLALLKEHPRFRELFLFGKGGSARWAGIGAYAKNTFWFPDRTKEYSNGWEHQGAISKKLYLGKTLFEDTFIPDHVGIFDDAHMLTIGATGSGKSTTALWPNLMMYEGSALVIDPKGEHAKRTLGRRQSRVGWDDDNTLQDGLSAKQGVDTRDISQTTRQIGSRCWLLDPFGEVEQYPSSPYNPLSDIDITSDNVRGLISALSDGCVLPEGGTNIHFVESAKTVFEGLIAHVLSRHPKEEQNLPFIYDLVLGMNKALDVSDPDLLEDVLIEMRTNSAAGGLPQLAANVLDSAGERERGSIMTTVFRSIKWTSDPAMRKALQDSPFSFENSLNKWQSATVYVVLPERFMSAQARWMRCLINLSIAVIQQSKYKPDLPILYILDEFPRMGGSLKMIEEGIVTLRAAGIKLWPIIQNIWPAQARLWRELGDLRIQLDRAALRRQRHRHRQLGLRAARTGHAQGGKRRLAEKNGPAGHHFADDARRDHVLLRKGQEPANRRSGQRLSHAPGTARL